MSSAWPCIAELDTAMDILDLNVIDFVEANALQRRLICFICVRPFYVAVISSFISAGSIVCHI